MKPYYEDDLVTLYHGDCREITAWLEADVLICDVPYGIAYKSGRRRQTLGVEYEERYCEIAAKRLAQDTLFGGVA